MASQTGLSETQDVCPRMETLCDEVDLHVDQEVNRLAAVSPTMTKLLSSNDDVSMYQLKWIEWKGKFSPVVTQNENGPCPLLALCNVLLLTGRMQISPGETVVTASHLIDLLGECLIESHPGNQVSLGERANYEQNIQDAMAIFPNLQTGLDVNVKFHSVSGFEFTCESALFDLLNVMLYHGWLVDPQDKETYEVVRDYSYNQLAEMVVNCSNSEDPDERRNALMAENFLNSTASQLTYHGLCELNDAVDEGQLCVFFRNNHFSTMYKCEGKLLLLVTDHGFLNELDHVWETLEDIDGGGSFLDAQFRWSSHSQTQQRREDASKLTISADSPVTEQKMIGSDLDLETALGLQQEEYLIHSDIPSQIYQSQQNTELATQLHTDEEIDRGDHDLHYLPTHPPNSLEEYQRAAEADESVKNKTCTLI